MTSLSYLKEKFSSLPPLKKGLIIILVLVLVGFSAWAGYEIGFKGASGDSGSVSPKGKVIKGSPEEPVNYPNPITGVLYKKSEITSLVDRLILGVIIENHTAARPQSGLSKADIVYEALAEGGITRFLAIFLQDETTMGPIRSNRPYFIDWLSEYDAAYAHVGGSPEGQARVKAFGIKDLDQSGIGSPTFDRVSFRAAPHNVYSTTEKLRAAGAARGYTSGKIDQWKFVDTEMPLEKRPQAFNLKISFLNMGSYTVEWVYNRVNNTYLRVNGGLAHKDAATDGQLEFKTVILQVVNKSNDPSGHGRLFMETTGSGQAKIFMDGGVVEGTWQKTNRTARTKFFDKNGQEIKFNRGKFWVEIVPPESVNTF